MKTEGDDHFRNPLAAEDSPALVLKSLAEDRGEVFTEAEYAAMREAVIEELAHGPVCRGTTIVTFGVIGLLLLLVTLVGIFILVAGIVTDYTLAMVGAGSIAAWLYVVFGYRKAFRNYALRPILERLAEVEELRAAQWITQAEYERIWAAIHISRAETRPPLASSGRPPFISRALMGLGRRRGPGGVGV